MAENQVEMTAPYINQAQEGEGGGHLIKEKHQKLAGVVKGVHAKLRKRFHQIGNIDEVWKEHCQDEVLLSEYADAMHHLATEIWTKKPETRIDWCRKTCVEYFFDGGLQKVLDKQNRRQKFADTRKEKLRENVVESKNSRSRSKSEERSFAAGKQSWHEQTTPNIQVLSSSANQVKSYLCRESDHSKAVNHDRAILNVESQMLSVSSEGTSPLDEASSQESAGQGVDPKPASQVPNDVKDDKSSTMEMTPSFQNSAPDGELIFGYPDGLEPRTLESVVTRTSSHQYNTISQPFSGKIHLLDVGSCFNAFQEFEEFQALGVDISPAVESVYHCDFLYLETTDPLQLAPDSVGTFLRNLRSPIEALPSESFHVVVFSLLLEYFPSTYQRWICCQKAQKLLMVNGILIIITPDSHHQNRNAPMIKSWKKAIESLGFSRWRYVKLEHLHCMVFRKVEPEGQQSSDSSNLLVKDTGPDMLYIPQDFHSAPDETDTSTYMFGSVPPSGDDFLASNMEELPGCIGSI